MKSNICCRGVDGDIYGHMAKKIHLHKAMLSYMNGGIKGYKREPGLKYIYDDNYTFKEIHIYIYM